MMKYYNRSNDYGDIENIEYLAMNDKDFISLKFSKDSRFKDIVGIVAAYSLAGFNDSGDLFCNYKSGKSEIYIVDHNDFFSAVNGIVDEYRRREVIKTVYNKNIRPIAMAACEAILAEKEIYFKNGYFNNVIPYQVLVSEKYNELRH